MLEDKSKEKGQEGGLKLKDEKENKEKEEKE